MDRKTKTGLDTYSITQLIHYKGQQVGLPSGNTLSDRLILADEVNCDEALFLHPCRIDGVVLMICTAGTLTGCINLTPNEIKQGMVAVFHPEHILQFTGCSDDFSARAIVLSSSFMHDMHIDLKHAIPIFMHIKDTPGLMLTIEEQSEMQEFYQMIGTILHSSCEVHRTEIIQRLLEAMFYKVLAIYQARLPETCARHGRKEEFFERFMELLTQYHRRERSMGFYADQLHITPKYLSSVIKEVSHKSAAQWIDDFVILEAKSLLRYSGFSIQEIAYQLNFSTQSFFGKYFKHHTGISPSDYKRQ